MDASYFKKMSRRELIDKAEEILLEDKEVEYRKGLCSDVHIFSNEKTVYATFSMPIRFVPLNSSAYYGAAVDFVEDLVSYDTLTNPEGFEGDTRFYRETTADKEALSYVFSILKADPNFRKFSSGKISDGTALTIRERSDHYAVTAVTDSVEYGVEVYKGTGEMNGYYNASVSLPPDDFDRSVEIKKE